MLNFFLNFFESLINIKDQIQYLGGQYIVDSPKLDPKPRHCSGLETTTLLWVSQLD
jgi:hypothetical protein